MGDDYLGKSTIIFLSMIDINLNDLTCINLTLHYVSREAKAHNFKQILTFHQPLYWKAMQITEIEPSNSLLKSIILRIGVFHFEFSFVGCMGHLMD